MKRKEKKKIAKEMHEDRITFLEKIANDAGLINVNDLSTLEKIFFILTCERIEIQLDALSNVDACDSEMIEMIEITIKETFINQIKEKEYKTYKNIDWAPADKNSCIESFNICGEFSKYEPRRSH